MGLDGVVCNVEALGGSMIQADVQRMNPTEMAKVIGLRNDTAPRQSPPGKTSTTVCTSADSPRTTAAMPSPRLPALTSWSWELRVVMEAPVCDS